VDIVCLQETKLELISNNLVRSLWSYPYVESGVMWCLEGLWEVYY
jgi:hypothetical protein